MSSPIGLTKIEMHFKYVLRCYLSKVIVAWMILSNKGLSIPIFMTSFLCVDSLQNSSFSYLAVHFLRISVELEYFTLGELNHTLYVFTVAQHVWENLWLNWKRISRSFFNSVL